MDISLDAQTEQLLDEIILNIIAHGVMPAGFFWTPGQPLPGRAFLQAMVNETESLRARGIRPVTANEEGSRLATLEAQIASIVGPIKACYEQQFLQYEAQAQEALNTLPRHVRRRARRNRAKAQGGTAIGRG